MIITEFGMLSNLSYWKTSLWVRLGVLKHKVRGRDGSLDRIDAIFGMMKAKLFSLRVDAGTKAAFFRAAQPELFKQRENFDSDRTFFPEG